MGMTFRRQKAAKVPSVAQARFLMRIWLCNDEPVCVGDTWADATVKACVKAGWLLPNGIIGFFPSGAPWTGHNLCEAGVDAIEDYLRQRRYKRQSQEMADQLDAERIEK